MVKIKRIIACFIIDHIVFATFKMYQNSINAT